MLVVDCINFDVGSENASLKSLVDNIASKTKTSWETGADVVVFPEYAWMNAARTSFPMLDIHQVAQIFWQEAFPALQEKLRQSDKAVILGSVPRTRDGKLFNTCPIFTNGEFYFQDKLSLTPWEDEFSGGSELKIFSIAGHRCAALICLDIEMPDIAQILKKFGQIDILFVPSATETTMGVERIARCASARSVELGCAVITTGLTGQIADYPFMDANFGRAALYLPALSGFENEERSLETDIESTQGKTHRFEITDEVFVKLKAKQTSTNPAVIFPQQKIILNSEPAFFEKPKERA